MELSSAQCQEMMTLYPIWSTYYHDAESTSQRQPFGIVQQDYNRLLEDDHYKRLRMAYDLMLDIAHNDDVTIDHVTAIHAILAYDDHDTSIIASKQQQASIDLLLRQTQNASQQDHPFSHELHLAGRLFFYMIANNLYATKSITTAYLITNAIIKKRLGDHANLLIPFDQHDEVITFKTLIRDYCDHDFAEGIIWLASWNSWHQWSDYRHSVTD
jgi:hypothetical protein